MPTEEKLVSITIRISQDIADALQCWAKFHHKGRSTYASQIVSSRTEAHLDLIDGLIKRAAKRRGITPQEMRAIWIGDQETEG